MRNIQLRNINTQLLNELTGALMIGFDIRCFILNILTDMKTGGVYDNTLYYKGLKLTEYTTLEEYIEAVHSKCNTGKDYRDFVTNQINSLIN